MTGLHKLPPSLSRELKQGHVPGGVLVVVVVVGEGRVCVLIFAEYNVQL